MAKKLTGDEYVLSLFTNENIEQSAREHNEYVARGHTQWQLEQAVVESGYELITNDDNTVTLLVQDDQFTGTVEEVKDVLESLVIEEYQATPSYMEGFKDGWREE